MEKQNKFFMKRWYFWLAVVFLTGINVVADQSTFGSLYFSEYIGIFVGSFLVITVVFLIGKAFIWIVNKFRNKQ